MEYIALSDNAARQLIDACVVFEEHQRVRAQARAYAGGMYWKRQDAYEYLVKTAPNNRQKRLGPRSPQLEAVYAEFMGRKQALEQRLAALRLQLTDAERTNKALKAGRVPPTVVAVLASIEQAGLDAHFVVVGTHALYAYEAAAGVRIVQGALATQDVDLLWDARRRVQFVTDMEKFDGSMLRVLQSADASFQRKEGHNETAINAKGFEVDFLRRMQVDGDPHPFRFTADEDDLWPVQAHRAAVLTSAPRFSHTVVASTGKMARMRTISPATFVEFKRWMADKAVYREDTKRRRDLRQASIVQSLLDNGLLLAQAGA